MESAISEAGIAIQAFGDFSGFNPHCHVPVADGCFYGTGYFKVSAAFELKSLEKLFRHKVFKMLLLQEGIKGKAPFFPSFQGLPCGLQSNASVN